MSTQSGIIARLAADGNDARYAVGVTPYARRKLEVNDPTLAYGRKPLPADQKRLDLVTEVLRQQLAEKGGLESVDLGPQAAEIRKEREQAKAISLDDLA